MPEEHAPLAPVRLIHAQGFHGPHEGLSVRLWDRPRLGHDNQKRQHLLAGGRKGEQLALQSVHQPVAILHTGQLLLDPHGGPLLTQPGVPGTVHRRQL